MDWFLRSLFPSIGKYDASHFPQTKEAFLQIALKYELIYVQSSYVYTVSPDPPRPSGANTLRASHVASSIVGSISHLYTHPLMGYGYP